MKTISTPKTFWGSLERIKINLNDHSGLVIKRHNTLSFWSNVYGFKMNSMRESVRVDGQVMVIEPSCVVSESVKFKIIDCMTVQLDELARFEADFELNITSDCELTGIGSSFDTYFNHAALENKVSFSTSPDHKTTHWQQTLFQFDQTYKVEKGSKVSGHITCFKNPNYSRSYLVELNVFQRLFKYIID